MTTHLSLFPPLSLPIMFLQSAQKNRRTQEATAKVFTKEINKSIQQATNIADMKRRKNRWLHQ